MHPTNEKIKILYSWIGPRGPIWNTELPNVLSFADVAEGSQTTSHKFWADDLWTKLFSKRKTEFELYPAVGIEGDDENTPWIFPFSLTWRVGFDSYFCGRTGILEFAHWPWHLQRGLREGNGYILIDHSVEAFMSDGQLNVMHGYFNGIHGFPLNKIIYLTGTVNAKEIYDDYCKRNSIPDEPGARLTIISYVSSYQIFSTYLAEGTNNEPEYDENKLPKKLFLMWNRRYRRHRTELALSLEKHNLIEKSYVSFSDVHIEQPGKRFIESIDTTYLINDSGLGIKKHHIENFQHRLPLMVDGETDVNKMCEDFDNSARPYYQNSLISIVTETNWDLPEMTLTEKSFKPSKEKHPFIIVGVKGVLKAMRELGFKTFGNFWDESYDEIDCPTQRMIKIADLCREIGEWSPDKILQFRKNVKPILEHNWNHLKHHPSENLINTISELIRKIA